MTGPSTWRIIFVLLATLSNASCFEQGDCVAVVQTELILKRQSGLGPNRTIPRTRNTIQTDQHGEVEVIPIVLPPSAGSHKSWDRLSMILPVVMVVFLAIHKLRNVLSVNVAEVSARRAGEFAIAMTLFLISGPAVIILNKHIMKAHHFHFPIVLASLGNLFMMILTRGAVAMGVCKLDNPTMEWGRYLKVVVLMAVFNFSTQVLGMWSYLFISVPEIQILKSITVVMVMVFATVMLKEPVNSLLVVSILVITAGTCISAIFDEGSGRIVGSKASAQLIGVILSILASATEAAKTICSQILMDSLKVFDGVYWSSPAFTGLAVIFVGALEAHKLVHHQFTFGLVGLLVLNAVFTSLIVLSSFWVVKLVGALTLKVITQARTVGLVLISVAFFREHCSPLQYVGYAVSLLGIGLYDKAKTMLKPPNPPKALK